MSLSTGFRAKPREINFIYFHWLVTPIAAEIISEQENGIRPSNHPFVIADVVLLQASCQY
jgi:hypothetical protein